MLQGQLCIEESCIQRNLVSIPVSFTVCTPCLLSSFLFLAYFPPLFQKNTIMCVHSLPLSLTLSVLLHILLHLVFPSYQYLPERKPWLYIEVFCRLFSSCLILVLHFMVVSIFLTSFLLVDIWMCFHSFAVKNSGVMNSFLCFSVWLACLWDRFLDMEPRHKVWGYVHIILPNIANTST